MTNDMTHGTPWKLLLSFSVPLLIGNLFQQFYNMADTIIVGRTLGVKELAAVGATGCISFLVIGFVQGLTSGLAVITAQRFGARDEDGVRRSVATSIIISAAITAVVTLISTLGCRSMLDIMNTPDDIIDNSYSYIFVIFAGACAPVFFNLFSSILRSLGDSKTPLLFLIATCILNIVLDFAFILIFHMGVAGAGLATVISQLISGAACLVYSIKRFPILRLKRGDWAFSWRFAWAHLRVGLPMAFQFSVTAVGTMILQSALNSLGSIAVAAYTTATKIDQLATQPVYSFGVALATFTAQNYGAARPDRIKRGVLSCTVISSGACVVGCALVLILCPFLVRIFVGGGQEDVLGMVKHYLMINSTCYIILGVLFIFRNVLQGIGSAAVPFFAGVFELVTRSAIAFMLLGTLQYTAICIAGPAAWLSAAAPLTIAYTVIMRKKYGTAFKPIKTGVRSVSNV